MQKFSGSSFKSEYLYHGFQHFPSVTCNHSSLFTKLRQPKALLSFSKRYPCSLIQFAALYSHVTLRKDFSELTTTCFDLPDHIF